jgi:lysophosphatidylcholine acyltransferase/lyso-PAF acetyltransferase
MTSNTFHNPFDNQTKDTPYEIIKMILMFPIAIIKMILFFTILTLANLTLILIIGNHKWEDENGQIQDIADWQRVLIYIPQFLSRLSLFILGYYWISECYYDNNYIFTRSYPSYLERKEGAKIIVANHVSIIDGLYMFSKSYFGIVAKAGHKSMPLIGLSLSALNSIWVPTTPEEKKKLPDCKTQIKKRINSKYPLMIFSEGMTKDPNSIFIFQKGAFEPLQPVQPIVLKYKYEHLDPSWTFNMSSTIFLIYRLCCQFYNNLSVDYLPIITPQNKTVEEFTEFVRYEIAYHGNFKVYNVSNYDTYIYGSLRKKSVNLGLYFAQFICDSRPCYCVNNVYFSNMQTLCKLAGYDNKKIGNLIEVFYNTDSNKDGRLSYEEFNKFCIETDNQNIISDLNNNIETFSFLDFIKLVNKKNN